MISLPPRHRLCCFLPATLLGLLLTSGSAVSAAARSSADFEVKAYGATGDGRTLDTAAINQAIAAAAGAGGGTVHFPAGTYASYSIHLKSNVTLYLEAGATILAADPPPEGAPGGYDPAEPNPSTFYQDFGHSHWHNSLIWGENLENIAILGPGRIFGRGLSRGSGRRAPLPEEIEVQEWNALPKGIVSAIPTIKQPTAGQPRPKIVPGPFGFPNAEETLPDGVANKAIALKNCRNVIFRDFTIYHGGHFAILATAVDNWTVDGLKIDTNRDGIDFDCCRNVRVFDCTVNSPYDDGICLKSTFGLGYARPTENITITNCQVSGYDTGTLLDGTRQRRAKHRNGPTGRIKFGTESNGGFRNITISNCVFEYCRGLALECVDGGLMEDVTISNITMRDIVNAPIFIRLGARLRGPDGTKVGAIRRIKISNVVAHNVTARSGILISGLASYPIEDLSLSNIFIDYEGGGTKEQGDRIVEEFEKDYPEPSRFGTIPAWGLFARHVKNLNVDRVEFRYAKEDFRPTAVLDDVTDASFDSVKFPHAAGATSFLLKNVNGFTVHHSPNLPEMKRTEPIESEKL
ncbi:MAG: glycoside hydrolase family 28 protein [Opitutaceae bacterium]|nr:glycoside hydrolase family 28 protein [Opitutaceae bacterium]